MHTGPLPAYRGPDPLFWVLRNRETRGGLCIHRMEADYDTGPILHQAMLPLAPETTYGLYMSQLAHVAVGATEAAVEMLSQNRPPRLLEQETDTARYYRRPTPEELRIDWNAPVAETLALVLAANPVYGGGAAFFKGARVQILQLRQGGASEEQAQPGTVLGLSDQAIVLQCSSNTLLALDLVRTEVGYFSGARFAAVFQLQAGDTFE